MLKYFLLLAIFSFNTAIAFRGKCDPVMINGAFCWPDQRRFYYCGLPYSWCHGRDTTGRDDCDCGPETFFYIKAPYTKYCPGWAPCEVNNLNCFEYYDSKYHNKTCSFSEIEWQCCPAKGSGGPPDVAPTDNPKEPEPDCKKESEALQSCSFYEICLEKSYSCGEKGYPIGYGKKYCNKFLEHYNIFGPKGKAWIDSTLVCLKKSLHKSALSETKSSCPDIQNLAFESHPKCYVDSGFCDLFNENFDELCTNLKGLWKVYDFIDFFQKIAFKQVFDTFTLCSEIGKPILKKFNEESLKEYLMNFIVSCSLDNGFLKNFTRDIDDFFKKLNEVLGMNNSPQKIIDS